MKYSSCPHCGARISLRQRLFPKKGEIHCARCGEVSYLTPGLLWLLVYGLLLGLVLAIQHWFRLPWWMVAVVVAALCCIGVFSPLRILTKREKGRQLVVGGALLIAYCILNEWVLEHRPPVVVPSHPPAIKGVNGM